MSFALDLSDRLTSHQAFHEIYSSLQRAAAVKTLVQPMTDLVSALDEDGVFKMLYCAGVFSQTESAKYRHLAQSIALNMLLLDHGEDARSRSLRLLSDLGNFPAVAYAAGHGAAEPGGNFLTEFLRTSISKALNTVQVGAEAIALTDFQKEAWDSLPDANAIAITAPTSAGKSFLVIEHMCRSVEAASQFCAVYVAPTRALLSEVFESVKRRLDGKPGIRISTVPSRDSEDLPKQVFILTQERFQVLLAISDIVFDLIVADEAQNMSDGSRGMILQECLEQALERKADTRLVMLAPGADGFKEVGAAIGRQKMQIAASSMPSVIQNRIVVTKSAVPNTLELSLLTETGTQSLGRLTGNRGFDLPASRLAAVVLELGQQDGSLVYSTGPKDSETVATLIARECKVVDDKSLEDLAVFIEKHIHERYGLADLVRKGVAFHYGKMPTLLRESLEAAFRQGTIRFLACTTTLFQGVNLPARNVFIDTPERGSGDALDPAAMWNFAGRAGRMRKDIVGNVFLVDYQDWPEKPMDRFVGYSIEPAFGRTVTDASDRVHRALAGDMPAVSRRDEEGLRVRSAAGLLISRAAKGDLAPFVERTLGGLAAEDRNSLMEMSNAAHATIGLPKSLLATNWTVDPFGLRRLYDNMLAKIAEGDFDELLPVNPHDKGSKKRYASIFLRIQRCVFNVQHAFGAVAAGTAVDWMKGLPYPALLAIAVRKAEEKRAKKIVENEAEKAANPNARVRTPREVDVNGVIRREFEMIEDVLRFQYVQLGKAYIDILNLALRETGNAARIAEIFDFPLALELGVATKSGWSFMELGLSRIAASALEPNFPNSNLSVQDARSWLATVEVRDLGLSPVIVEELKKLNLVQTAA
ncbi:DEAD/DEAH box helicase [Mesorhizobium sp.]|uniref:DEAD/DEAH box helicase n=1 Tax=Mesorhizobium sp. TaxID=1871066 RepID=UPI001209A162|nr:DEAD/DEAH box helicase [Mesorhizobium sp.]TIV60520.1 MAG: DEAD/DEAH box helicase [Mesorhizobium sp.]